MSSVITTKNLSRHFQDGENIIKAVDDVSLNIEAGEFTAIIGPSGSGKSTLLNLIGGLDNPTSGAVELSGTDIAKMSGSALSDFRRDHIGFIFQFHNLLPEFSALENICIPAYISGMKQKEAEKNALQLLERLKLENRAHHKPSELSGGEQQRVAVARALINQPTILLADEPSGNLDSKNANDLHQLILEINKEFNQTCIVVTHNEDFANLAHRKLTITDGLIKE